MKYGLIVGVDEVGRGPLAGPVTVCAFAIAPKLVAGFVRKAERYAGCPLRDSKKLSPARREKFVEFIQAHTQSGVCAYAITSKSAVAIDTYGISVCISQCVRACVRAVAPCPPQTCVRLDAGLRAPEIYGHQRSIVRGDESEPSIAFASILAKQHRDAYMKRCAKKFPCYGFEHHVGYGTATHRARIATHGFCAEHRKSFCSRIVCDPKK